jgi:hypothetical protein
MDAPEHFELKSGLKRQNLLSRKYIYSVADCVLRARIEWEEGQIRLFLSISIEAKSSPMPATDMNIHANPVEKRSITYPIIYRPISNLTSNNSFQRGE